MEEIANLINDQVFQVDQMQNLQWKFSYGTTLKIGGLAVPPVIVNYSLSEENGIVFLNTSDPLSTEPLIITVMSKNPVVVVITQKLSNKTLVTLRKS